MTTRAALSALAATLLALPSAAHAGVSPRVAGEVLVKFREGTPRALRDGAVAAHAHRALGDLGRGFTHVKTRPGETVEEAIAGYLEDPGVEWAQPNFVYRASAAPTDPAYGQQWALRNAGQAVDATFLQAGEGLYRTSNPGIPGDDIDAERAWDLQTDCRAAIVAVVDTGVNYAHQDLAGNMWIDPASPGTVFGHDFIDGDADPMDHNGHGTHVAGIVAARANNGVGTAGVCWTARIMAVRVLDAVGSGTTVSISAGVDYAVAHGASVVNLSLGGGGFDAAFAAAIDAAVNAGVVVVVAAGNSGTNNDVAPTYPCSFPSGGLLCVAALDQGFALASFSNYGRTSVDVAAPGTNVLATWAGTHALTDDPSPGTGWTSTSTSGTGFAVSSHTLTDGVSTFSELLVTDPAGWPASTYAATTDDRVWKTFDTSGGDVVTAETFASVNVAPGDYVRAACRVGGGDPFGAGRLLEEDTDLQTAGSFIPIGLDVTACRSATTSVGFQLQSVAPSSDRGLALTPVAVRKLTWNTASYNTIDGTSMAAPVVAGIAALVRAYQPAFTPADVVGAITGGGLPVPALSGVKPIRSGKAARAFGALTYVNPPRGLTYTVR